MFFYGLPSVLRTIAGSNFWLDANPEFFLSNDAIMSFILNDPIRHQFYRTNECCAGFRNVVFGGNALDTNQGPKPSRKQPAVVGSGTVNKVSRHNIILSSGLTKPTDLP